LPAAMWLVAALTFVSGVVSAVRMRETCSPVTVGAAEGLRTEPLATQPTRG
jgi:hypothetical protein